MILWFVSFGESRIFIRTRLFDLNKRRLFREKFRFLSPSDGHLNGVLVEREEKAKPRCHHYHHHIITRTNTSISNFVYTYACSSSQSSHFFYLFEKGNERAKEKPGLAVESRRRRKRSGGRKKKEKFSKELTLIFSS